MPRDKSQTSTTERPGTSETARSMEELDLHQAARQTPRKDIAEHGGEPHDEPMQIERETINPNLNYGSQIFVDAAEVSSLSPDASTAETTQGAATAAAALGTFDVAPHDFAKANQQSSFDVSAAVDNLGSIRPSSRPVPSDQGDGRGGTPWAEPIDAASTLDMEGLAAIDLTTANESADFGATRAQRLGERIEERLASEPDLTPASDGSGSGGSGGLAPLSFTLNNDSVLENSANGSIVGQLLLTGNGAGGPYIYELLDDAGGRFTIAGSGLLTVADATLLDFESTETHTIALRVTDSAGNAHSESFAINVGDVNEAPTDILLDSDTIAESAVVGDLVGTLSTTDPENPGESFSYSLVDDAGGRFAIDPLTGAVTVANSGLLDYETATSHDILVQVIDSANNSRSESFTINLTDDTSEAAVGAVTDSDGSANSVSESAANGTPVGITALAADADATDSVTYSLADDAGGRFAIDANSGVITVADGSLLDYEAATSHTVTVVATSSDGSTSTESFTINLTDDSSEAAVGAVTDSDGSANSVSESSANGTPVGITALASDADATDSVTYSLADDAGGRFAIDANSGVITVADSSLLDYEATSSHTVTVKATSSDGSTSTETFTVNLTDDSSEASVGAVTDSDGSANSISESAANGTSVGITALAADADATDSVAYSLADDAGGRFAIDANSGVITVADGSLLDYEAATSHTVTVKATSSDGSTSTESFTINLTDDTSEAAVGAVTDNDGSANSVSESAANGTPVGITALAADADATDSVAYSLADDAGGRFAIDANSGVVIVADGSLLDYEAASNHTVTVVATSSDGSTSTESFTVNLTDDTSEAAVGAVTDSDGTLNTISESSANGSPVGITALAADADATDSVAYSLADDAGGRFAIDANSGVVTVADSSLLDYEAATSHTVTVKATSSDGSTSTESFTINLTDDTSEAAVGAVTDNDGTPNTISESAANDTPVGITALAADADATDSVAYSLADDAGGRFAIDANSGVITVADGSLLDYEAATSHTVTVKATSSDGSTSTESFTINLTDDTSEAAVGAVTDNDGTPNTISESAANDTPVGITALAADADATDSVAYSLADDAGGRFAIDANSGVITVADSSLLDYEAATSHTVTVKATSSDGSTSTESFTINLTDDTSEAAVGAVTDSDGTADRISESAANGTPVGITALAADADATDSVTYSLDDDAGGRFSIDANSGVITVADSSLLDYEAATSHTVTVVATSSDGSTSAESFTINLADTNDAPAIQNLSLFTGIGLNSDGGNNAFLSTSNGGAIVGGLSQFTIEVAFATANNSGGGVPLFSYHAGGGSDEIELAIYDNGSGPLFAVEVHEDYVDVGSYDASAVLDGEVHHVSLTWDNVSGDWEIFVDGASVASGSGIAAGQTIAGGGTIVLGQEQDSPGGGFDPNQSFDGTLYDVRIFDDLRSPAEIADKAFEQVNATEPGLIANWRMEAYAGGSVTDSVAGNDLAAGNVGGGGWVASTPVLTSSIPEDAADGRFVARVAVADPDSGDNLTYSLTDDAGGRFTIDANTGIITVVSGALLDFEAAASHDITVKVTDSGGLTDTQTFAIALDDVNEAVGPLSDSDGSSNRVSERDPSETVVGITALAVDQDGGDTVTYSLDDDAGGRFAIDANSGVVTIADGSLIDHEAQNSHSVTVRAISSDGTSSTESFTINVSNASEPGTVVTGSGANDSLYGGGGSQAMYGYGGDDRIYGGGGSDHLYGGSNGDRLFGENNSDRLYGGTGDDTLSGDGGGDRVYGEQGHDTLYGGSSGDRLYGGSGDDALFGDSGNDRLYGDAGNDWLYGGSGRDTLSGGLGDDSLFGGNDNDLFIFQEGGGSDYVSGGTSTSWTDVIELQDAGGGGNIGSHGVDWTVAISTGSVQSSGADYLALTDDAAGIITLQDGSQVSFEGVERIEW